MPPAAPTAQLAPNPDTAAQSGASRGNVKGPRRRDELSDGALREWELRREAFAQHQARIVNT